MPATKNDPKTVDTGGGGYFAGKVETGGGDVVGGNQFKTVHQQQAVSLGELLQIIREIRTLLPQAGLEPDEAEAIEGDFRVIEEQTAMDPPKGGLIKAKLTAAIEQIQAAGKTSDAITRILALLRQGAVLAGSLF